MNPLLIPRYKLIADYPGNVASLGSIIEDGASDSIYDKYPGVYEKLEWWKEREQKEMPKYVCHKEYNTLHEVKYWCGDYAYFGEGSTTDVSSLLPITKKEYDEEKNINQGTKSLFLNEELSNILKQKGFNESCLAAYLKTGKFVLYNLFLEPDEKLRVNSNLASGLKCTAPLYQQATDWLRKKHSIVIKPFNDFYRKNDEVKIIHYYFKIGKLAMITDEYIETTKYTNYYDALVHAITASLNVIE